MPNHVYVLCVKGLFGWVKPIAYFRSKDSAERIRAEYQARKHLKRYIVKSVPNSLSDGPRLYL